MDAWQKLWEGEDSCPEKYCMTPRIMIIPRNQWFTRGWGEKNWLKKGRRELFGTGELALYHNYGRDCTTVCIFQKSFKV